MNIKDIFDTAILAYQANATRFEPIVDCDDGRVVRLYVVANSVVNMSLPHVELLTADSTPQSARVDEEAKPELEKAIQKLIDEGQALYTHLRANWCLPAYVWRLKQ